MPLLLKRILKITLVLISLLIIASILLPILYKKQILELVKSKTNENINGKFDFKDLNLSLFKHFPKLSVELENTELISYAGGDTTLILSSQLIAIDLDLWNILSKKEKIDVKGLYLNNARINLINNGAYSNYEIAKSQDSTTTTSTSLAFKLSHYEFNHVDINIQDTSSILTISDLNHQGSVYINDNLMDAFTTTKIESLSLSSAGVKYLNEARLESMLDIHIDQSTQKYSIKKNEITLNDLKLILNGEIQMPEDKLILDLQLKAPNNEFKNLFSLIPSAFTKDYKNVKSEGTFNIDGWIKGDLNSEKNLYPNWEFNCSVANGGIQYQGMPVKLNQVNLKAHTKNVNPDLSGMEIQVEPFSFNLNKNGLNGYLKAKDASKNAVVDAKLKGVIDLDDFKNFIPLSKDEMLGGKIEIDVQTNFLQSDVQDEKFERVNLAGFIGFNNLIYKSKDQPTIGVTQGKCDFSPKEIKLDNIKLTLGKSDMLVHGNFINPLAIVNDKATIKGSLNISGNLLDANEWMDTSKVGVQTSEPSSIPGLSERSILNVAFQYNAIQYEDYDIKNIKANAILEKDKLSIISGSALVNKNNFGIVGELHPITQYVFNNKTLQGNLNIKTDKFDSNTFLASDPTKPASNQTSEPFIVPEGMNLDVVFTSNEFLYDKINLKDLNTRLSIVQNELQIKELSTNSMGGKMVLSGVYNSSNPEKPTFDMKYEMQKMQFGQMFESIKTFKLIAPIAKFIEGKLNSSFIFSGSLLKDMSPDLSSINIGGLIETIDAAIKGYKPLDAISDKLSIKELKNLSLKNTKNWFTVENGQVTLKELKYQWSDIDVDIAGNSKLQGPMDFNFKFRIPRNKLNQNAIGQTAEKGLNFLKGLGSKAGVNIELGSHVNVLVNLKGNLLSPDISYKLLGTDGKEVSSEASNIVDTAKDSLKKKGEEEINKAKEKAIKEAERVEDSLKKAAAKKIEEEKNKVLDKASEELKKKVDSNLVNQGKDILKDKMGKGAGEILKDSSVDKLKDKLKDWDPFKKKKK